MDDAFPTEHSYLRRLSPEAYKAYAVVHWSMTMKDRRQGWLSDLFHAKFRELLTHGALRYRFIVPHYVLMPDHIHFLVMGTDETSDQRLAIRFLRKQLNWLLKPTGSQLQKQPYDHVLREESRKPSIFESVVSYIRENPLRAGLTNERQTLEDYPYAGCLIPGYPELSPWSETFWASFWKLYWRQRDSSP